MKGQFWRQQQTWDRKSHVLLSNAQKSHPKWLCSTVLNRPDSVAVFPVLSQFTLKQWRGFSLNVVRGGHQLQTQCCPHHIFSHLFLWVMVIPNLSQNKIQKNLVYIKTAWNQEVGEKGPHKGKNAPLWPTLKIVVSPFRPSLVSLTLD